MKTLFQPLTAIFLVILIWFNASSSSALELAQVSFDSPDKGADTILALTNEILSKQIEMERFYLRYRILATKEPRFRRLRYALMQEGAAGLWLASDIGLIREFAKTLSNPDDINGSALKGFYATGLVGSIIGGASSAVELMSNGLVSFKNSRLKATPSLAKKYVLAEIKQIDTLCARRDALVAQNKDSRAYDIWVTEGKLLKHFRDWELWEFAGIYADIRSYQSGNNFYYLLDAAAYSISCVAYGLSIGGVIHENLNGPVGVTGAVSDSMFIGTPGLSTIFGSYLYKYWWHEFSSKCGEKPYYPENVARAEMHKLKDEIAAADSSTLNLLGPVGVRLASYLQWSDRYDVFLSEEQQRLNHLKKVALQSNITGPLVSAPSLSQDILDIVGFYKYRDKPRTDNALTFAGVTADCVGAGASFMVTNQYLLQDYLYVRKLRKQGMLPEQLLEKRLKTLDEIEHNFGI